MGACRREESWTQVALQEELAMFLPRALPLHSGGVNSPLGHSSFTCPLQAAWDLPRLLPARPALAAASNLQAWGPG